MRTILSLLFILLAVLLSIALVLGFALGIGWVLTRFLPFTLFEGTLLGLIASVMVGTFWNTILNVITPFDGSDEEFDDEDDDDYDTIPSSRFFKTDQEKTWEAWLRYTIANRVYVEFQDWPQPVSMIGNKQQQELAIRLADMTLSLLKAKTARAKQLRVTMNTLKREMGKLGQRPYDTDILHLAIGAINEELDYYYDDIITVIEEKSWNKPYPLSE